MRVAHTDRPGWARHCLRALLLLACAFALVACSARVDLLGAVPEDEANEVLAALLKTGIDASKTAGKEGMVGVAQRTATRGSVLYIARALGQITGVTMTSLRARRRVATKYPRVAKEYYEAQGRQIEIIRLNGSIELAPILGLSDVIVDIVETGTTLKENDLGVFADVAQSSARLIANKASYQFSAGVIDGICGKLREKL